MSFTESFNSAGRHTGQLHTGSFWASALHGRVKEDGHGHGHGPGGHLRHGPGLHVLLIKRVSAGASASGLHADPGIHTVIASLVQFVEMFLQKFIPSLYTALGIYLPLITTNCAVLGVALLNTQKGYNFIESVVYGVTGGVGFLLAIVLFASVRERMEFADYPKAFEGFPIALISAGLIALAFMGFSGLKIW